jgi:3-dehydroquinate synthase
MKTLMVELAERRYPIHIGSGLLSDGELVRSCLPGRQIAVITNDVVGPLYADRLVSQLQGRQVDVLQLPDGEANKTLDTWSGIHEFLSERRHNRGTTVVALGGGVVGDMAGFAAATWQRGVRFVQIPTTLLAQVDSSVGGKTGVNLPAGKNLVGAFWQPVTVLADTDVLATLPLREYRAGLAEVLKYGVIADRIFFEYLVDNAVALLARQSDALTHCIERSCAIKAEIVAGDEREEGRRAILNFGHTFGHAIENLSGYGVMLHGEAVALGMVMAADLSRRMGLLEPESAQRIKAAVASFGLPVRRPNALTAAAMRHAFGMDKKVTDGRVRFVLATALGAVDIRSDIPGPVLDTTLNTDFLCEIDG